VGKAAASTIMVIGINSDFTYLMQYYTRKSGRQALVSSPDKEALTLAKREKPAAVVLEADLAGAVGWDVLQALKADQTTCHIPVVVCSWLDEATSELAERAACYLQKPISYQDFLAALVHVGYANDHKRGHV